LTTVAAFLAAAASGGVDASALPQDATTQIDPQVFWAPLRSTTEELEQAYDLMKALDAQGSKQCYASAVAEWAYSTNITEENKKKKVDQSLVYASWNKEAWTKVQEWKGRYENFQDENLKRQFENWNLLGSSALEPVDYEKLENTIADMTSIYSTAKICDYWDQQSNFWDNQPCDLNLEPELKEILKKSNHYEELTHIWKSWRDNSGKHMRKKYSDFVKLANKAAKLNGYDNMGDMWLFSYESQTFRDDVNRLWEEMKPLYQQVHAYVRRKLRNIHGADKIGPRSPLPAHLLGNMWAQSWSQKLDLLTPYPGKETLDVSDEMVKQGYTAKKMFDLSEKFFVSLNLTKMPQEFWDHSIIEKPKDREIVCHASAWDFCNHKDFRIKQCTSVTMDDLITVHHEMGHIQYYLQYNDQPYVYRTGANPGFHEAVGDVLALSVSTPKHLHKIGLLKTLQQDAEADLNFLMAMALDKIVFLPFAYTMDRWRWDVFSGAVKEENWNCHWWNYRSNIQGVKPPVKRSELDFDPGAKYHIPGNTPYIRYFVSFILQFQFHKSLCLLANEYDPQDPNKPLHQCDIYQSTEAGAALSDMLTQGASIPWPEALKKLTGTDRMDASIIREYFKPLEDWLKKDNEMHGEFVGWEADEVYCG